MIPLDQGQCTDTLIMPTCTVAEVSPTITPTVMAARGITVALILMAPRPFLSMDPTPLKSASDDFDLLTRAHRGDALAARLLVMKLAAPAHRLAWRMLGDRAMAEDVVQEGLEKLFRIRQYQGDARLSTYFHTLVSRLCLDRCRALDPVRFDADLIAPETVDESAVGPEQLMQRDQETTRVQLALQALPPRQRLALSLWAYQDSTVTEIADVLQIDRNAADQLLHRAKAQLKKRLEPDQHG